MTYMVQYRNILGANRKVEFDVRDEVECRNAVINELGHDIDEEAAPLRIEYFNTDGIHTDTWTCDNVFDSDIRHQWQKGAV